MAILWGDTFPKFHLVTGTEHTDTFTGDGITQTFSITLKKPQKNTVQIVASYTSGGTSYTETFTDDGNGNLSSDLGETGTVNYDTGDCSMTLAHVPDDATNITFNSTWETIDYDIQFTAPDLTDLKINWQKVKEYELLTFAKVIKTSVKWRGVFSMHIEVADSITSIDNLRLIASWRSETDKRRIIMYPRPNYLGGFYVVLNSNFEPENLMEGKWIGNKIDVSFITENVFDEIPTHTGGVCDVNL